jgi:hypothetical protein
MTTTTQAVEGVIKTDVLGRMRTSAARWKMLLDEFERSGLSGTKFAQLSGIKYQTLATWLQKRRRQARASAKPGDSVRWLEAVVEKAQGPATPKASVVMLRLPGGAQIELANLQQVPLAAALLHSLESPCGRAPSC